MLSFPEIIGHRGVRGQDVPENSIAAFLEAIRQGAGGIELDARICLSGEIVVFHDKNLKPLTNGRGRVKYTEFEILRALKLKSLGQGNHQIPTLDEVLDAVQPHLRRDPKFLVNIEIKGKHASQAVADIIKRRLESGKWKPHNITVSHFYHKRLKKIKEQLPEIALGLLFSPRRRSAKRLYEVIMPLAEQWGATSINLPIGCYVKGSLASRLQAKGLIAVAWTSNEKLPCNPEVVCAVVEQKIPLITDYPAEMLSQIKAAKRILS